MFNNTTSSSQERLPLLCDSKDDQCKHQSFYYNVGFSTSVIITVLSAVAVAENALILAAIWKKTFVRKPFHIFLSALAFTDLCTGLIAQPCYAAATFIRLTGNEKPKLVSTIRTIGETSAIFFITITILLITLMSIERWLYMSRRSLVTSRRGYLAVTILLLIPIPVIVFRVLANDSLSYGYIMSIVIMTITLFCYLTTSFAYFKVFRIIRHHQQQVQASETCQNFGQSAIDLAKYKKSVASMLYILLLFSFCFLPYIVYSGVYVTITYRLEFYVIDRVSLVILFLSSTLNPCLYLWRMNDIRIGVKQLFVATAN